MIPTHKRFEDQDGFLAKLRWIVCHPAVQGAVGALLVGFLFWVFGFFQSLPATYAQKTEVAKVDQKHDINYRYLDERKLDKADYQREHTELETRTNTRFDKIDKATEKIFDIVQDIRIEQRTQYRKVNKTSNTKGDQ